MAFLILPTLFVITLGPTIPQVDRFSRRRLIATSATMPAMRTLDRRLRTSATGVLDTLFPPICAGCGRRGHWVCGDCRPTIQTLGEPACDRCGALWSLRCVCDQLPDAVISIRSAFPFDGWVRHAIHCLKYEGERARARHLGDLLIPLLPLGVRVDTVVPVPLHPTRLRERGFNQAMLLARRFSASLDDISVVEIARTGSVTPQVGLSSAERTANVANAFVVPDVKAVDGRNLVLIDDVITTTATVTACATALAEAGAHTIRCLSIARAE